MFVEGSVAASPRLDRGGEASPIYSQREATTPKPRRLRRPRTKGHHTPEGAFYAGRPSGLANPFEHRRGACGKPRFGHARAFKLHRRWLLKQLGIAELRRLGFSGSEICALYRLRRRVLAMLPHLRGLSGECWCTITDPWCHLTTILELANAPEIA